MDVLFDGSFGLERETLRVGGSGALAKTPHPFTDEHFDRDFGENQLEIITPVCSSTDALISSLTELHARARKTLSDMGEYMWLCSNPPHIDSEDEIPIARFTGELIWKRKYREKLETRYGKRLMLLSGIHFNYSLPRALQNDISKDDIYFRLLKQTLRHSWLLVLLTAASPVYDKSYDELGESGSVISPFASLRCSDRGYWNNFTPILDYSGIQPYISSIEQYVNDGHLISPSELYLPVRIKSGVQTADLTALKNTGIDHIELRMFDLNPLSPLGIFKEDLDFAHYLLLYLMSLPDFDFTPKAQEAALKNHKAAALFDLDKIKIDGANAVDAAVNILDDMSRYFGKYKNVTDNIALQKRKLTENTRYCVKLRDMQKDDFCAAAVHRAKTR